MMVRRRSVVLAAALVLLLAACDVGGNIDGGPPPWPTLAPTPLPGPERSPLLVQFCNDDTGSYPRSDFQQANQLMAASLQLAVTPDQRGVTLYATAITRDTFAPENTLQPAFQVPPIPPYPVPPTPLPTNPPRNPVSDASTATAIAKQSIANIVQYNQAVAAINKQVADARAKLTQDAGRLTSWNPPLDSQATSIFGCFQLAAERFAGQSAQKLIYIASDLQNNTNVDYTQGFVANYSLKGTVVHVIFFPVSDAAVAAREEHAWCTYLEAAGASAVLFNDPASSQAALNAGADLIDQDVATPAKPCL